MLKEMLQHPSRPKRILDDVMNVSKAFFFKRVKSSWQGSCCQVQRFWKVRGTSSNGSNQIAMSDTSQVQIGYKIADGTHIYNQVVIPLNAVITAIDPNVSITISANATGTLSTFIITDGVTCDIPFANEDYKVSGNFMSYYDSSNMHQLAYEERQFYADDIDVRALYRFANSAPFPVFTGVVRGYDQSGNGIDWTPRYSWHYMPVITHNMFACTTDRYTFPGCPNASVVVLSHGKVAMSMCGYVNNMPASYMGDIAMTFNYTEPHLMVAPAIKNLQNFYVGAVVTPCYPQNTAGTGADVLMNNNNPGFNLRIGSTVSVAFSNFLINSDTDYNNVGDQSHSYNCLGQNYMFSGRCAAGTSYTYVNGKQVSSVAYNETKIASNNSITMGLNGFGFFGLWQGDIIINNCPDYDRQKVELRVAKYFGINCVNSVGENRIHNIVIAANSLANGYQVGYRINFHTDFPSYLKQMLDSKYRITNRGVSGIKWSEMISNSVKGSPYIVDPIYNPDALTNICVYFEGHNSLASGSISALQAYNDFVTYSVARKAVGWHGIACTTTYNWAASESKVTEYNNYIKGIRYNSTAYPLNATINVSGNWYQCTTAGTSASSVPTFDTTIGNTTTDGTAVWTRVADNTLYDGLCDLASLWTYATIAANCRDGTHPYPFVYKNKLAPLVKAAVQALIYKIDPTYL